VDNPEPLNGLKAMRYPQLSLVGRRQVPASGAKATWSRIGVPNRFGTKAVRQP